MSNWALWIWASTNAFGSNVVYFDFLLELKSYLINDKKKVTLCLFGYILMVDKNDNDKTVFNDLLKYHHLGKLLLTFSSLNVL